MAVSNFRAVQAYMAGVDLTGMFGRAVILDNTGKVTNVMPAGGPILGVLVEPGPISVDAVGVVTEQGVKVPAHAAGVIPAGAQVMVTADGRFVAHSGSNTAVGVANEAAAAAGALITITFTGTM